MNNNKKDPRDYSEEELKKLIEELKRSKQKKNTLLNFGYMLHKDYLIHLLLSFAINLLMLAVVMGLLIGIGDSLVELDSLTSFLIAAALLTLMENFIKILLYRYAFKLILYSLGILSMAITVVLFYTIDIILKGNFHFASFIHLLIFTVGFTFFRLILSTYIKRWIYKRNISTLGGKK
jgi:uncharacterized membrane protein YvlD (DUF360 family)